jgi:hypothetical protein
VKGVLLKCVNPKGDQMRPYQGYLRSEIKDRQRELWAESHLLEQAGEKMESEAQAGLAAAEADWDGVGINPRTRISLQVSRISSETSQRLTAIAEDVRACQFELEIRDDPELLEALGPGRD